MFSSVGTGARLVGREDERRWIDEFVDQMHTGQSSLVIVGDAGIGKTILWLHGIGRAEERGVLVATSRPTEEEFRSPATGLVDLTERWGRGRSDVPEGGCMRRTRRFLSAVG